MDNEAPPDGGDPPLTGEPVRPHSIALRVVVDNAAAVRAYEQGGFRRDGRHRECFRGAGRWHDMDLMSVPEGELA